MDKSELGIPMVSVRCMAVGLFAAIALAGTLPACAAEPSADANLQQWLLRRLNEPTVRERAHEREGNVYIYDGLTDREVDQALNAHFDRIEYMMFVGTVKTDAMGAARHNEQGNVETESGGCGSE
jgi:hypothetical protein